MNRTVVQDNVGLSRTDTHPPLKGGCLSGRFRKAKGHACLLGRPILGAAAAIDLKKVAN